MLVCSCALNAVTVLNLNKCTFAYVHTCEVVGIDSRCGLSVRTTLLFLPCNVFLHACDMTSDWVAPRSNGSPCLPYHGQRGVAECCRAVVLPLLLGLGAPPWAPVYVHVCACVSARMCVYLCMCMCICVFAYLCAFVHVWIHVCMWICVHMCWRGCLYACARD
jgi:hypothetical protein